MIAPKKTRIVAVSVAALAFMAGCGNRVDHDAVVAVGNGYGPVDANRDNQGAAQVPGTTGGATTGAVDPGVVAPGTTGGVTAPGAVAPGAATPAAGQNTATPSGLVSRARLCRAATK